MPFILRYLLKFFGTFVATLLLITAVLYAMVMFTPAETRATLYMPKRTSPRMTEEQYQKLIDMNIERYHLNDPYPVQYFYWISSLVRGNWGYSPTLQMDVLSAIIQRTPATAELTLVSMLIFIPLGLVSGVISSGHKDRAGDHIFRLFAFIGTSLPPFILAIIMMVFFYIDLGWFAPGQISSNIAPILSTDQFRQYTGLMILDGLLNHRPDVSLDALRHLAMPAITLAFAQWAIIGRVTRATMIEEQDQEYIIAARSRGLSERNIIWHHALLNAIPPVFTNTMLSAASLLTGVFLVEILFNLPGVSNIAVKSMAYIPDAPAALGFGIYSVIIVLILMGVLDLVQSLIDPRIREGL
jgi:peptide/nickel transport system permease protein